MKNKRLLSPSEAAAELGISIRTIYRWEEAGKLHPVRTVGNQRRLPIEEISRLRRQGKGESRAERCVLYARVSSVRQEQGGTWLDKGSDSSKQLVYGGMRWSPLSPSKPLVSMRSAKA